MAEQSTTYPSSGAASPGRARPRPWALRLSERQVLLLLGDLLLLSAALLLALHARGGSPAGDGRFFGAEPSFLWWAVLWALWLAVAVVAQCYDLRLASQAPRSAVYGAAAAAITAALYLIMPMVSAPLTRSRLAWWIFALLAMAGVALWRIAYARVFWQPTFTRRVLVVGAGGAGRALAHLAERHGAEAGIHLIGYIDDDVALHGGKVSGHPVLGGGHDLLDLVHAHAIDEVAVAITDAQSIGAPLLAALVRCWERGVAVRPMPLYYEEILGAVPVLHLGHNLLALTGPEGGLPWRLWAVFRRLLDIVAGAIGLLALALLTPPLTLAIRLDSPGPVFYQQQRVGRGGRPFRIHKFRTMVVDAERDGAQWASARDPRVTRVGRFLRKTRLDELPQLWSILVGDMTLIGPRPERPEFVRQLAEVIPYYAIRHALKPGLTGWAQVRYPYGASVDDALQKLQFDLYYVKHRGPVLDAAILLHTIRVVLRMEGH